MPTRWIVGAAIALASCSRAPAATVPSVDELAACAASMERTLREVDPAGDHSVSRCDRDSFTKICFVRSLLRDGTYRTAPARTLTCSAGHAAIGTARAAITQIGFKDDAVLDGIARPGGEHGWTARMLRELGFTDDELLAALARK